MFPFQWLLVEPGGGGVSTITLGVLCTPRHLSPGIPAGLKRSETQYIIDATGDWPTLLISLLEGWLPGKLGGYIPS